MKIKFLVLFCIITFLIPLAGCVIMGLLGVQHPLLKYTVIVVLPLCAVIGFTFYLLKRKNVEYLFFLTVVFSLLIELITAPLRGHDILGIPGGAPLCSVVTFTLYFLFINLMLKRHESKLKPSWILLACLIGCCLLQLPLRLFDFNETLISLPDFLFHLFGIVMGYFFYASNKYIKSGIVITSLLCCVFMYSKGYDLWLHKLNFGTFTGKVAENYPAHIVFQNDLGENINIDDLGDDYLVLDFWYAHCGVCFRAFPEVQRVYDKWLDNEQVQLYAVFCRMEEYEETPNTGTEILRENGYTFPVLSIDIKHSILKEMGVNAYPTVLIFNNKDRTLIFRGDIETAEKYLNEMLK